MFNLTTLLFYVDWVVVEAVWSEPVSAPKFPVNRENTGNFCRIIPYYTQSDPLTDWYRGSFPPNSLNIGTGNFYGGSGNLIRGTGNYL